MPKRTTPFQAIVHLVRSQVANPEVTVTESKMLYDQHIDAHREVDIVIEGEFDGEPITTSVEVIEHRRPAAVTWVEQQIAKHRPLPTNRLVLVSKSGFTKNALTAVAAEGGWVDTIHPIFEELEEGTTVETLYADLVRFQPTLYRAVVVHPDAGLKRDPLFADTQVFSDGGVSRGTVSQLATEALNLRWLITRFMIDAHSFAAKEELKGFSLLDSEIPKYLHLVALEVNGNFSIEQSALPLSRGNLAGRQFASGEGDVFGSSGVWVRTTHPKTAETKLSLRFLSSPPVSTTAGAQAEPLFPELLKLPEPKNLSVKFESSFEDNGKFFTSE